MKKPIILLACAFIAIVSKAQIGIGTTSPNTTLDVRGSLAVNTRSFSTTSETVISTDYALLFTGTSACTVTLPTAVGCTGRIIHVKNTKTSSVPVLTIATTSSQTIDGSGTTWLLDDPNESVNVVSDGANWKIMGQSLPAGSGTSWTQGGNTVSTIKKLGTIDNIDLPFITNNTEKMRLSNTGNVAIGASAFDGTNPEKLLINAGTTLSTNLIYAKGTIDNFLQFNIQNLSNGNNASSDIVATANNGSNSSVYVDLGINSQGYSNSNSNILNGSNTAYLYASAAAFYIGNGTTDEDLIFFTNDGAMSSVSANGTKRMTIKGSGEVIIGNGNAVGLNLLTVGGDISASAFNVNSDRRLKTNISRTFYGLKEVMNLQPVSWNWKDKSLNATLQLGLIAQDAKKVIPEIVSGNEQNGTLSINYTELIPVLVNAIKEQQQQIDELKKRVKVLENK